jgi:threonine/homoserine/homoserine lactone efflux protein
MPTTQTLAAFLAVSALVMITPGPSNMFILGQGVTRGRPIALAAVCGMETAAAIRLLATVLGLAALLNSSPLALEAVRWGGAAYVTYLGVRILGARVAVPTGAAGADPAAASGRAATVRRALAIGIGNPKMLIFYVSFLPQFIHHGCGSTTVQIIVLGSLLWTLGAAWDLSLACASGPIGDWMRVHPRAQVLQLKTEGAVYLGLAAWIAITGS